VIVKYNSAGAAQWAKTTSAGSADADSVFYGVAVSADGLSVYVVGSQVGAGAFQYGTQTAQGVSGTNTNAVIVAYDSAGDAQWAKSVFAGTNRSAFYGVAVDGSDIYAAGAQVGANVQYQYKSEGASATGQAASWNAVLVQYDSAGEAQWAQAAQQSGGQLSVFYGVAADGLGKVYAAGFQQTAGEFTYGGASAQGTYSNNSAVIVQFDSAGAGQWARAARGGNDKSCFTGIAADGSGGVYASGYQTGAGKFTYSPSGAYAQVGYTGENSAVVKYSNAGDAEWAQVVTGGNGGSRLNGVAVDGSGNVYAAGYQAAAGLFTYSPGGASAQGDWTGNNAVVVQYDSATGAALWAKAATGGGAVSTFAGVAAGTLGISAVGAQTGDLPFNYGGATATGGYASGTNAVAVGWR